MREILVSGVWEVTDSKVRIKPDGIALSIVGRLANLVADDEDDTPVIMSGYIQNGDNHRIPFKTVAEDH